MIMVPDLDFSRGNNHYIRRRKCYGVIWVNFYVKRVY